MVYIFTLFCLFIPVYVYVGYPVLLFILSKLISPNPIKRADIFPPVTLLVSCFNEAGVIRNKIQNALSLDYPAGFLEVIFVSDGSFDGTDEIIQEYSEQGIRLIRQEGRKGKTSALNLAVPQASGEVVVFSDANAIYKEDAIKILVRNFNDKDVGYVVGAALYTDGGDSSAASSENAYWQYEVWLKTLESNLHSVVGGDGAIYAIRKNLYETLDEKDINDFVNPLQIIAKGYRGVFDGEAVCYEETAGDFSKEGNRKKRIVNRSFRGLMKVKTTLNPFKVGMFSFEVISHKLLRWLVPFFLVGAGAGAIHLSLSGDTLFKGIVVLGLLFSWLAVIGYFKSVHSETSVIFYYPYYFILINYCSMMGVLQALRGNIQVTWSSPRAQLPNESKTGFKSICFVFLLFCTSIFLLKSIYGP